MTGTCDIPTWIIIWGGALTFGILVALLLGFIAVTGESIKPGTTHKGFGR